jgi:hypothetical protein
VLRRALAAAKVGHSEKLHGMRRLDTLARAVEEGRDPFADVNETIARERAISRALGGRTVLDDRRSASESRQGTRESVQPQRGQLPLFTD